MEKNKKRVFIIDGYGQIFRSYYAFFSNPLRDSKGNNVSAVFGFFNNLMMLVRQYKPDYLIVALDSKGKTFRHQMYPLYKANREKTPEDLHAQIPVIVNMLDAMNIRHFAKEGMEADDIIATLAKNATSMGLETVMVTGDKDLMQLVNDSVFALRPPRKGEHEYRLCAATEVKEIFGVRPDQICDYLTILGDSSDNVPGIDGIGEKGAVKLLNDYDTLANAYQNIDSLSAGIKTKLQNAKDHIALSCDLIKLKDDLFGCDDVDLSDYLVSSINWYNAIQEFYAIGSEALVRSAKRFIKDSDATDQTASLKEISESQTQKILQKVQEEELFKCPDDFKIDLNNEKALVGYDLKSKIKELNASGFEAQPYFDIMIAAWLLNSSDSEPSFDFICQKYLTKDKLGQNQEEKIRCLIYILTRHLEKQNLAKVFFDIEMPLVRILAKMEEEGILLDKSKIQDFEQELNSLLSETEQSIYTICGHSFNVNSPKQLQEVLFTERKLNPVKKTKSGYSTDSEVLEELSYSSEDPVPALILRYRALSKLLSTYIVTLPQQADSNSRVHTSFVQTGTATGRLSSKNPNLQNIPVRTEEGRKIRDGFCAKPGCCLISADYSQIELAVMASLSGDPSLSEAFIRGEDVHTKTASLIFSEFPEMVTEQQRRIAKTINFGVIYGMSAFRLAQELKIPRKEAQKFIESYFAQYPQISKFIADTIENAKENQYVCTKMGHKRFIPDINSSNKIIKGAAERIAVNTVVQGTAAEIVKLAMISVDRAIKERNLNSRILLQVHDEIILEVPVKEKEQVLELVKKCMETQNIISVPLRVSISSGQTWGQL